MAKAVVVSMKNHVKRAEPPVAEAAPERREVEQIP